MFRSRSSFIFVGALVVMLGLHHCNATNPELWVMQKSYFGISIDGVYIGRIVFGLFSNIVPKTVYNFLALSNGNATDPEGNPIAYPKSNFHRVIPHFMNQGGDILYGNGYGFTSIYGMHFPDENFDIHHCGAGFIGMANRGKDTNGCQIYITTALTSWLDNKHVIFGKVLEGMDVVCAIANNPTDSNDRPIKPVIIEESGQLPLDQPFIVPCTPVDC